MTTDEMWSAFARAIVKIELPDGAKILRPAAGPVDQTFPFESPVHIVTAYNPDGLLASDDANRASHEQLVQAVAAHRTVATVGSGEDGTFPEPGLAIEGGDLAFALELGSRFGQVAIYRWTPDALIICGVDDPVQRVMSWRLEDPRS